MSNKQTQKLLSEFLKRQLSETQSDFEDRVKNRKEELKTKTGRNVTASKIGGAGGGGQKGVNRYIIIVW